MTLAPGAAQEVGWDYRVPSGVAGLAWELDARAGAAAGDKLRVKQKVITAVPVKTLNTAFESWLPAYMNAKVS